MKKQIRAYNRDDLYYHYIVLNENCKQIANLYGLTEDCVRHDLSDYGIKKPFELCLLSQGVKKVISQKDLYDYYIIQNHNTEETAQHFNVHERTIRRRLREYGIVKDVKLQKEAWRNSCEQKYGGVYQHSEVYRQQIKPKMIEMMKKTCLNKYGVESVSKLNSVKKKAKQTCMKKYGKTTYTQTVEYHKKSRHKYLYQGEYFDSSWELALWIYATDHNEAIERTPCSFQYKIKGVIHYYYPDFRYKGKLLEIKGNHLMNQDQELVEIYSTQKSAATIAKTKCMRDNNVEV